MQHIEQITTFFEKHQEKLQALHPGLSLGRLLDEIQQAHLKKEGELEELLGHLLKGMPLAYLTGQRYFYSSYFRVNPDVLIPRFETEILVAEVLKWVEEQRKLLALPDILKVVDVGTGCGNILLTIMKECHYPIYGWGIDLSSAALAVARINGDLFYKKGYLLSAGELLWQQGDRLENFQEVVDVIVSNPPYIARSQDRSGVHAQVEQYEPDLALFLNDDEYENWFSVFFAGVERSLRPGGLFVMEGHENHLENLQLLLQRREGFDNIQVVLDLTGRHRFLRAERRRI